MANSKANNLSIERVKGIASEPQRSSCKQASMEVVQANEAPFHDHVRGPLSVESGSQVVHFHTSCEGEEGCLDSIHRASPRNRNMPSRYTDAASFAPIGVRSTDVNCTNEAPCLTGAYPIVVHHPSPVALAARQPGGLPRGSRDRSYFIYVYSSLRKP